MTYRRLGQTGLWVSLLSFGSHTDPADRVRVAPRKTTLTPEGQARRDRIIASAFDLGVNLLDVYDSEGQWEPAARLVRGRRDKVLISLAHEIANQDLDRACRLFSHVDLYRFHTADIDGPTLENWDRLRKAKEAGKIRAIGIATHIERTMTLALAELEGLDYLFFPYNVIHARADYSRFLPQALERGVGLIAMKPLASGSIMRLDPQARPGLAPEFERLQLWQRGNRPILPAADAQRSPSSESTLPAASGPPNKYGLHYMLGNVWKWCSNPYFPYPFHSGDSALRVLRGGGFADSPDLLDPAFRHTERASRRLRFNGLRLARGIGSK